MNSAVKNTFIFVLGAAVGSVVTWKLLSDKCEQRIQQEVAEVKETYSKKAYSADDEIEETYESEQDAAPKAEEAPNPYDSLVDKLGYRSYYDNRETEKKEEVSTGEPHVITYDDFGMLEDYTCVGLTYHADNVLANERCEAVEDVEELIGNVSLDRDNFEDDALYVRNDKLKIDFEILLDEETYEEVLERKPYLEED